MLAGRHTPSAAPLKIVLAATACTSFRSLVTCVFAGMHSAGAAVPPKR